MSDDAYAVVINGRTYVEMYAAQSLVRQARSEARDNALEEAAKVADSYARTHEYTRQLFDDGPITTHTGRNLVDPRTIAAAIRKLKEKT